MNIIFSIILLSGVGILLFTSPGSVIPTMMDGASQSISFAVKLFIIYAVWVSVIKILEKSGANRGIAKVLSPITKTLFRGESEETYSYLNLNLSANLLGMGGAATPMGIKATETMKKQKNRILLVVINSTSIQLVPTTILSLRAGLNAASDIILPFIIVNVVTTVVGVLFVKIFVR